MAKNFIALLLLLISFSFGKVSKNDSLVVEFVDEENCILVQDVEEKDCPIRDSQSRKLLRWQRFSLNPLRPGEYIDNTRCIHSTRDTYTECAIRDSSGKVVRWHQDYSRDFHQDKRFGFWGIEYAPSIPNGLFGLRVSVAGSKQGPEPLRGGYFQFLYFEPAYSEVTYENLEGNPFGDSKRDAVTNKSLFSIGYEHFPNRSFGLIVGLGLYTRQKHDKLYDPSRILGEKGEYFIPAESKKFLPVIQLGAISLLKNGMILGGTLDIPMGVTLSVGWGAFFEN